MIHHHLYRARLALLGALVVATALLVAEFPLSMLLHQRREIAQVSTQLTQLESRNAGLQSDIAALGHNSTIAEIAHEEYGLVDPGQLAYVVLPGAGSPGANDLSATEIPPRDLVATDAPLTSAPRAPARSGPGLWRRFVDRLEFWHSGS